MRPSLLIACGALAHELVALQTANRWQSLDIRCLPAHWHNTPEKIVPGIEALILEHRASYHSIHVAYGDCGTGGDLDRLLQRYGIARLPGAHCYHFFSGEAVLDRMADDEPGSFWLTDYLARHFERLILEDLGITAHPALRDTYFGNYTRVVHLAQSADPQFAAYAAAAADTLGLPLITHRTGLEPLSTALRGIGIRAA